MTQAPAAEVAATLRAGMEGLTVLASGCVFGLAGGFAPGPTTAVLVAQTVRFGFRDGLKVAIAPLLTDGPIIALSVLLVGQLAQFRPVLGVITLLGAAFLVVLAIESFRVRAVEVVDPNPRPHSIRKGLLANLLNPHPYLFWLTIGSPTLLRAWTAGWSSAVLFLAGFYACLVGSKVVIAWLVARSRDLMRSRAYVSINRLLGVALCVFALWFAWDALPLLGMVS
jgi:threonine/homoserine/homoserine lactone efflux protein